MREKPDSDKESKDQEEPGEKRRLDLSVPQVAGSAIAAVIAAKLASNLGVYGTILGAGVVSAIATCGGTIFQHFFKRTGEQIRDVTVQAKPKARQVPVTAATQVPETFRTAAYTGAVSTTGPVTTTWGRPQDGDADRTTVLPAAGAADPTAVLPAADPDAERTQLLGSVDATQPVSRDDATRVLRTTGPAGVSPVEPPLPSDEFTEGTTHRTQIRSWKRPLVAAAVVFGVTMAGITTYELVADENFSGGNGTTIGNGLSGNNTSPKKQSTPSEEPSEQPSGHGTPGTGDGSDKDGGATQDPNGTGGQTPGTGSGSGSKENPDKGTGTDPDKDKGGDSGDDGSKTDPTPTPTPTPTPSSGGGSGTGTGGDAQGETPAP
ncbi:hypothetical protein ACFWZ2_40340 [Streptomyces sp. NPDC059002]|uniref:hypothetical protein n=1 Tax=Streptomyces sp. NPDC059002 TaxID=3346690 RepID=UPI0036B7AC47